MNMNYKQFSLRSLLVLTAVVAVGSLVGSAAVHQDADLLYHALWLAYVFLAFVGLVCVFGSRNAIGRPIAKGRDLLAFLGFVLIAMATYPTKPG
jgi:uncharacterized membrane protein YfcA